MNKVYFSLGSNIGDRIQYFRDAIKLIGERIGEITARSSVYETEPWGKTDQPVFLNMVVCVKTALSSSSVLRCLLAIEKDMGRIRADKWSERNIDIDILFFNEEIISEQDLKIPHPYLQERSFVLKPLFEIAPDMIHPLLECSVKELLINCTDKTKVIKYTDVEL